MAALLLLYHSFSFLSLFSFGLYHLISATRSFLRSPSSYTTRPFHPLPVHRLRHLPLLLSASSLLLSLLFHLSLHSFSSLRTAVPLLLFLLLLLLTSPLLPLLPPELVFLLSSLSFFLLSFSSPLPSSSVGDLAAKCDSLSSTISLSSAAFSLALSLFPRLFLSDLALSASLLLKALWSLQTALTLYVEAFVPEGCHLLLDLPEPSTRCDLDESRARAGELLDLAFALHSLFVAVIVVVVYASVARVSGGGTAAGLGRRSNGGSYEALPTSSTQPEIDHVQMKAIGKNSAQA
ncbi:putative basic proline-rich protein-like [Iris pallida]|uniref:Basic proline-rich protein-like n=1 Tax=Iris pallida TaxID=29817 RepID=A0AAX6DQ42_IRIPA|nr:putative basic proline-rich protein-like [Iris pallida]KAJ6800957.1 putative basic proline-rich protein-like [Iris pallida]